MAAAGGLKKTKSMTRAEVRGFIEALASHNPAPETAIRFSCWWRWYCRLRRPICR
jgi:hypothetical protein